MLQPLMTCVNSTRNPDAELLGIPAAPAGQAAIDSTSGIEQWGAGSRSHGPSTEREAEAEGREGGVARGRESPTDTASIVVGEHSPWSAAAAPEYAL